MAGRGAPARARGEDAGSSGAQTGAISGDSRLAHRASAAFDKCSH